MGYYQYNKENAKSLRPDGDSFIKNVPQEKQFSPKGDTKHRIRFMPPWSELGVIVKHMKMHFRVGQGQVTFLCPDNFGEECPFCQTHVILKKDYDKYKPDVDQARPANRYWSNIVWKDQPQAGVMVYNYGWTVHKMIYEIQDTGMYGDISDPKTGHDLMLVRSGTGRQARDAIYADPNAVKLENPKWLDQIFDLDTIFIKPNMATVEAAFKTQPWKVYTPPELRKAAMEQGASLTSESEEADIPGPSNEAETPNPTGEVSSPATGPEPDDIPGPVETTKSGGPVPTTDGENQDDAMATIDALEQQLQEQQAEKKGKKGKK